MGSDVTPEQGEVHRTIGLDKMLEMSGGRWSGSRQGAQDRLVPVTKGCIPEAPDGGHSSQSGTLLEVAATPVPDAPPDVAGDDDVDLAPLDALDRVPVAPPADAEPVVEVLPVVEVPVVDPVAAALVVAAGVD